MRSGRQIISAKQRNCNYRPDGRIAQHVIDATIEVPGFAGEDVVLSCSDEPIRIGQLVINAGEEFFLVVSKFSPRFYAVVCRDGSWLASVTCDRTAAMVIGKAQAYRQEPTEKAA